MNKIVSIAVLLLWAILPLRAKAANYVVKVSMNPQVLRFNHTVTLLLSTPDSVQFIATKDFDSKGTATFTGTINRDNALAYLQIGGNDRFQIPFIIENGTVEVGQKSGSNIISAQGTPLNDAYLGLLEKYSSTNTAASDEKEGEATFDKLVEQALHQHADDALGAMLFLESSATRDNNYERTEKLWALLGNYPKSLKEVADKRQRVIGYHLSHEGMMFRDFMVRKGSLEGKDFKLSDMVGRGRYVFVDFWASWCTACRMELPNVRAAYANVKDKNIDFVGILIWDKRNAAMNAIKDEKLPWMQIIDTEGISGRTYGVSFIPQTFLFAPDGTLLKIGLRGKALTDYLEVILK